MVPAEDHLDRPAVVELLKAFGRGELNHAATQAAAWHLNNDLSWPELAAKLQGTRRSPRRPPYFSREEIQAGAAYANEAARLAEANSATLCTGQGTAKCRHDLRRVWRKRIAEHDRLLGRMERLRFSSRRTRFLDLQVAKRRQ